MPASISMTSPSRAICAAALGRLSSRFAPTRSTAGCADSRAVSCVSAAAACRLAGASDIANATASMQIGVRAVILGAVSLSVFINVWLRLDGSCSRSYPDGEPDPKHGTCDVEHDVGERRIAPRHEGLVPFVEYAVGRRDRASADHPRNRYTQPCAECPAPCPPECGVGRDVQGILNRGRYPLEQRVKCRIVGQWCPGQRGKPVQHAHDQEGQGNVPLARRYSCVARYECGEIHRKRSQDRLAAEGKDEYRAALHCLHHQRSKELP